MCSKADRLYLKRLAATDRLEALWRRAIFNCCFAALGVAVYFGVPMVAQIAGFIGFWITFRMIWETATIRTAVQGYRWAITLQEKSFSVRDAVSIVAYILACLLLFVGIHFISETNKPPFHLIWLAVALGNLANFFWLVPRADFWQVLAERRRHVLSADEVEILTRAGRTLGFEVSSNYNLTAGQIAS